jgi:hypothetical protein
VHRPLGIEFHRRRLGARVIVADYLDEFAIAGRSAVLHDDTIVGLLLGAYPTQSDLYHTFSLDTSFWIW